MNESTRNNGDDKNIVPLGEESDSSATNQDKYLAHLDKRLEVDSKRVDVQRKHVELLDASDQRHYQFNMQRHQDLVKLERDKVKTSRRMFYFVAVPLLALIGFVTYMFFYGDPAQKQSAEGFFPHLITAIAGYGVINFLIKLIGNPGADKNGH